MNPEKFGFAAPPIGFELPYRLRNLADLAYNLWWTWDSDAECVFRLIDPIRWESLGHNPVTFLRSIAPKRLEAVQQDRYYLEKYDTVVANFESYMHSGDSAWYARQHPDRGTSPIAYFSTEFGLHESLPFYAGGLGILSGDHLKEASDLGLPIVALGFLYTQGYFNQHLTEDGWQVATHAHLAFPNMPVYPVLDDEDHPITISVNLAGRSVAARLWRIQVGRVPLFLLDTNIEANSPADRNLTARLYTSDLELRISQELVLGIGGVTALRALGYNPVVWHLNEGHSAFLVLERIREMVAVGHSFETAAEMVRQSTVFTTHTPVPAGHDEFPFWMIDKYFSEYWPTLGLERESFIDLGKHTQPWGEMFSMSLLALNYSGLRNGVSELHGQVAREMWADVWPDQLVDEVPISHITNGVHTRSWLASSLKDLFDEYFDPDWLERLDDLAVWEAVERIPDKVLWDCHRRLKQDLVAFIRERSRRPWKEGQVHPVQVVAAGALLDPEALTIGFARRFATYKRADLILHDPGRLLSLVASNDRPVQIIFAGKAHPADEPGKALIQKVYREVKRAEYAGRLVFLEDYDINLARHLVQGVDVWLNTPRKPNEASGTSGQKAALNGALNLSILDGWWLEAYNEANGWAIGQKNNFADEPEQDRADAESLYRILENKIVPLYYQQRSADGLPGEWLGMMKQSIASIAPLFSMRRMLRQYIEEMYLPSITEEVVLDS